MNELSNNIPATLKALKIRSMKRILLVLLAAQVSCLVGVLITDPGVWHYGFAAGNVVWSVVMWFGFGRQFFNEYYLTERIDYLTKEATRLWGLTKIGSHAQRITAYELWKRIDAKRNEAMRIHNGQFEPEEQK